MSPANGKLGYFGTLLGSDLYDCCGVTIIFCFGHFFCVVFNLDLCRCGDRSVVTRRAVLNGSAADYELRSLIEEDETILVCNCCIKRRKLPNELKGASVARCVTLAGSTAVYVILEGFMYGDDCKDSDEDHCWYVERGRLLSN